MPGVDYNQPPPQPANSSYNPYQTEPPAEGTATAADAGAASPQ
ncbi:hypothetical protein ACFSKM_14680 [Ancylobacter dichloromethanicus]